MATPAPARLDGLRRITSGGRFIPEIDGLRLLAILLVLNDHIALQVARARGISWPRLLELPGHGTRGVFLFFALSGFILGLPFARRALADGAQPGQRPFSYRSYLLRRVTRLEPPYVVTLVLRLVLLLAVMKVGLAALLPHFLASLFYVHNLVFGTMSPVSPPTWSLEVEVQFYLLAPWLSRIFSVPSALVRRALLVAAMLGFSLLTTRAGMEHPRLDLSLAGNLQYFCAGLLLCDLHVTGGLLRRMPPLAWDALGLAVLIPVLWSAAILTEVLLPFGILAFYLAALRGNVLRRFFAAGIVSIAGGMCYSIYLTHGTVLAAVASALAHAPLASAPLFVQRLAVGAVSLTAVFLAGAALFLVLERPCMNPLWPSQVARSLRLRTVAGARGQAAP